MKTIRINNCKKALLSNKLNDKEIEVSEGVVFTQYSTYNIIFVK